MHRSILALLTAGFLSATPVLGFQSPAAPTDARRPATRSVERPAPPPLSGPKVHTTEAPGAYMSFSEPSQVARMYRSNLRQYGAILKEIELSEDQRQQVAAVVAEYGEATRAFQREHGAELRRLRALAAQAGGAVDARRPTPPVTDRRPEMDQTPPARETDRVTDRPAARQKRPTDVRPDAPADAPRRPAADERPGMDEASRAEREKAARAANERLAEIRATAPPQEPYMKRLYDLLTEEQQTEFDGRMEVLRQAQEEQQMRRRLVAAGVDPDAMQGMDGMQDGDRRPLLDESDLTPQMRERLRRLREERQRLRENRGRRNPTPPTPADIEFEKPQRP